MARAPEMTHRTGWRKDFATRMRDNGIEGAAAENVAYGAFSTQKLFSMWMASTGHRRNMLDPRFEHYGLASAEDGHGRKYWALVLGGRRRTSGRKPNRSWPPGVYGHPEAATANGRPAR